ncbi:Pol polyprotein [Plecturocebus cupreus]
MSPLLQLLKMCIQSPTTAANLKDITKAKLSNHLLSRHTRPKDMCHQEWQISFTQMPPIKQVRYLLTIVDTISGWTEACPTTTKKAHTVTSILIHIIHWFKLPSSIQSNNRPIFFFNF